MVDRRRNDIHQLIIFGGVFSFFLWFVGDFGILALLVAFSSSPLVTIITVRQMQRLLKCRFESYFFGGWWCVRALFAAVAVVVIVSFFFLVVCCLLFLFLHTVH